MPARKPSYVLVLFWFLFGFFVCFLRHYPFRTNVGACLIELNVPRVEEICSLGLQEVLDQPLAIVTVHSPLIPQPRGKIPLHARLPDNDRKADTTFRTVGHF